jgi:hypothetical protein
MSAMGQKRTWRDQIAMSALPPIADIPRHNLNVRFCQQRSSAKYHFLIFERKKKDRLAAVSPKASSLLMDIPKRNGVLGILPRTSCRPSGSFHMGRRLDAPHGHRMVLQEPQLPLRAQLRPGRPNSDRRSSRWHGIRRRVRDGTQRRTRLRLERPNCPEFDYSPTAWPVSRPLTIR